MGTFVLWVIAAYVCLYVEGKGKGQKEEEGVGERPLAHSYLSHTFIFSAGMFLPKPVNLYILAKAVSGLVSRISPEKCGRAV